MNKIGGWKKTIPKRYIHVSRYWAVLWTCCNINTGSNRNTMNSKDRNIEETKESKYDRVNLHLLKATVQRQLHQRKYKLCKFWMKIEYIHCHTSIGFQLQLSIISHFILWLKYLNSKKNIATAVRQLLGGYSLKYMNSYSITILLPIFYLKHIRVFSPFYNFDDLDE